MAHNKRTKERIEQIAEEVASIKADKEKAKTRAERRKVGEKVIDEWEIDPETGEQVKVRRNVRKYLTTLDELEKRGQLDKALKVAFDEFANAVSLSSGACIDDKDLRGSSSCNIANMEGGSSSQFGPRSMSDQMLKAERKRQYVMGHIPRDMMKLANRLVMEETGITIERPAPLTDYGHQNGFNQEQQARSSGATMAIDICRIVHHALKSR